MPNPFRDYAGFIKGAQTGAGVGDGAGWVNLYRAVEQGIDVGGRRYVIVCETHHTMVGSNSLVDACQTMNAPANFCEQCAALVGDALNA